MGLMLTMMECPFLLMHLGYYIITHYLNILHSNLQNDAIHPNPKMDCPYGYVDSFKHK